MGSDRGKEREDPGGRGRELLAASHLCLRSGPRPLVSPSLRLSLACQTVPPIAAQSPPQPTATPTSCTPWHFQTRRGLPRPPASSRGAGSWYPPNVAASDLPPRAPLHSLSHAPLGKSDSSLRCSCEFLRFPKSARRVMTAGVGRGKEPVLSSPPPSSPHPGPGKMAMLSLSPSVTGAQ